MALASESEVVAGAVQTLDGVAVAVVGHVVSLGYPRCEFPPIAIRDGLEQPDHDIRPTETGIVSVRQAIARLTELVIAGA